MPVLNCICIKWGSLYSGEDVNKLYRGAKRHSQRDVRFICLTDNRDGLDPKIEALPLREEPYEKRMAMEQVRHTRKGALRKIAMFRPDLIKDLDGPLLVLDIDVLITGDLDEIASYAPGYLCMSAPFHFHKHSNTLGEGSVTKFEPRIHTHIYEDMARNPEASVMLSFNSEQAYTSVTAHVHGYFKTFPDGWIISFKQHCRPPFPRNLYETPKLPADARVVCFHGHPKIGEAIKGHGINPRFISRPCDWIAPDWQ
jgi:hypothetical protein